MYLKSLELHGFKSFPEKTVLNFGAGATVIVGPNGSGKSNITDAMRWVLGELSTKNIRGSKMEDVIFVGADGRRPMSFAEVSVTFDDSEKPRKLNSPYEEITVTRRYYRSGDSEYFINRKQVRLRDINELFMNTGIGRDGYSIIGQGRIAEIISKKNEDRRSIFEETAGITKYRYRKHESERRLGETEANMLRVRDILSELEDRLGPMQRAAEKARRYIELFAVKKEADVSLWLYDMERRRADAEKLSEAIAISSHELEMIEDTESQLDAMSERLFEASEENKAAETKLYGEIREKRELLHRLENEYRLLENNAEHGRALAERDIENAEKYAAVCAEETKNSETLAVQVSDIEQTIIGVDAEIAERTAAREGYLRDRREKDEAIEKALGILREHEAALSDIDVRLGVLESSGEEQKNRSGSLGDEIAGYESDAARLAEERDRAAESVDAYEANIKSTEESAAELQKNAAALEREEGELRERQSKLSSEIGGCESRIAALRRIEEHFEGYQNSVRFVMNKAGGELRGICGPLSQLIKTDPDYAVAIEIALGAGLQNIVVEDERAAKDAIAALKRAGAGRATFCPITSVKGQSRTRELEGASSAAGFVGFADELVRCDERYRGVVSFQLGRTAVFRDIDAATDAAKSSGWRIRAVTLDGQQINAGGSFTGGSVRHGSGMLTRASEIEKLERTQAELAEKKQELSSKLSETLAERERVLREIADADEKCTLIRALMRSEQATLDEAEAKLGVTQSLIEKLRSDAENMGESERARAEEMQTLAESRAELLQKIEAVKRERQELSSAKFEADSAAEDEAERIGELNIRAAELRRDLEFAKTNLAETAARAAAAAQSETDARETAARRESDAVSAEGLVVEKKNAAAALTEELASMEERRAGLETNGFDFERKIKEHQAKTREVASKKELVYRAHTKNENRYEQITTEIDKMTLRLWDEYELTSATAAELGYPQVTDEGRAETKRILDESKNAIRALGQVNVDAIEEYAEVKERYESVKLQMDDLEKSKSDLEEIIASVEEEMRRMFVEAFEKINRYFGEVFRELFGGGSAELSLTDPEDVLNCGIEISAAPPGKMIKNLSLLSGGEQAFIAIALLFALIRVNPSPFCIFDEIEAALDEVNVARVARYMTRVSKDIQVIMITHRRGTMEIADTLYGVTMPSHGISKVFTLDVDSVGNREFAEKNLIK